MADGKHETVAFGVEESSHRYRLTAARYVSMAEFLRRELEARTSQTHSGSETQARGARLRLLDVGCDQGRLILFFPPAGVDFFGIDVSRSRMETARQRGYAALVRQDLNDSLPFRSGAFDIVVCSHVLEHFPDPAAMVAEVERVLAPGGFLVVGVPITMWFTRLLRKHLVPLFNSRKRADILASQHGHSTFFTIPSLRRLLVNFAIQDIRGFRFFSSRHLPLENWRWFYRLNTAWGRLFPRLTSEVNVIARKAPAGQPI